MAGMARMAGKGIHYSRGSFTSRRSGRGGSQLLVCASVARTEPTAPHKKPSILLLEAFFF